MGRLQATHEEHSALLTFPDRPPRRIPAVPHPMRHGAVKIDRIWSLLEDFGDKNFSNALGYVAYDTVPAEAWFPSKYPYGRLVLILGFAVANFVVGVFGMGIYLESFGLTSLLGLPGLLRTALWQEQPDWLVVPSGCAIEDVLAQGDSCQVDLSFVAPWEPHQRLAIRQICSQRASAPNSADNFINTGSTDLKNVGSSTLSYSGPKWSTQGSDSDSWHIEVEADTAPPSIEQFNPQPSCMTVLGQNCSQLKVGVERGGTCYVYRKPPYDLRLVLSKADELQKVHADLDDILSRFHGPLGKVEAKYLLHLAALLSAAAIIILLCDVIADKLRVRRLKKMLKEGTSARQFESVLHNGTSA